MLGTGEHGVGLGKKMYLTEELGEGTVALMKTIKAALDPLNLLNPGKVSLSLNPVIVGLRWSAALSGWRATPELIAMDGTST